MYPVPSGVVKSRSEILVSAESKKTQPYEKNLANHTS